MADPKKIQESKDKYLKEKVDRFPLAFPKGQKDIIQAAAKREGKSMNGYILEAIMEKMARGG